VISLSLRVTQRDAAKFAKKLLGEKDVDAVLQRLDRLTEDEARIAAAETLRVVHGLVHNMSVVLEGKQTYSVCTPLYVQDISLKTERHQLMMSGKCLVCCVGDSEVVPACLTSHQKPCIK
jgi:hypothetical protein